MNKENVELDINDSEDPDQKLIELVRMYEVLWNTKRWDYKNVQKKNLVWNSIASKMSAHLKQKVLACDCKKRFGSLRHQFNRASKKLPSGSGFSDLTPKLQELSFLKDNDEQRQCFTNIPTKEKTDGAQRKSFSGVSHDDEETCFSDVTETSSPEVKKVPSPKLRCDSSLWSSLNEMGIDQKEVDDDKDESDSESENQDFPPSKQKLLGPIKTKQNEEQNDLKHTVFSLKRKMVSISAGNPKKKAPKPKETDNVLGQACSIFSQCATKLAQQSTPPEKTDIETFGDTIKQTVMEILEGKTLKEKAGLKLKIQTALTNIILELDN